jgi:hypothetical protein
MKLSFGGRELSNASFRDADFPAAAAFRDHRICEMRDAEFVRKIPLRTVIRGETVPPKFKEQS